MSGFNDPYYAGPDNDWYAPAWCGVCGDEIDPDADGETCTVCRRETEEEDAIDFGEGEPDDI